jgi:hypothetical protein
MSRWSGRHDDWREGELSMTVTISLASDSPIVAEGRNLPIHICISGQDLSLTRAVGEFNQATGG